MDSKRASSRVCGAPGCPSVQYHERLPDDNVVSSTHFPEDPARRSLWFRKLGVIPSRKPRLYLCVLHFDHHHIRKIGHNGVPRANWTVEYDALPTLNVSPCTVETSPAPRRVRRCGPILFGSPRKKQRSNADCRWL